jgi:hypothetical protein
MPAVVYGSSRAAATCLKLPRPSFTLTAPRRAARAVP